MFGSYEVASGDEHLGESILSKETGGDIFGIYIFANVARQFKNTDGVE